VLVFLGFAMVLTFMALIMTKRLTPMVALILVPTIFGLFAGAGLGIGDMVIEALGDLAPTAALLMFAIISTATDPRPSSSPRRPCCRSTASSA
jgi:CitMHS family citrate-Mg2+:H+ or citrate-Ca2+:H+ symporter